MAAISPFAGKQITAWSYSRYGLWKGCAFRAACKFLLKLPDPGGPAMARGNVIHKEAENYLNGIGKKMPPSLSKLEPIYSWLRTARAKPEQEWAFTTSWKETSWFGPEAWCRIKVDVEGTSQVLSHDYLYIGDHKTGQIRPGYEEQLELYAVGGFLKHPTVNEVETQLLYVDHGETVEKTYTREQFPVLQKQWEKRVKPMLADTRFVPTPSDGCRWCPYSKAKGGPCKF